MSRSPLRKQFPTLVGEHFEVSIDEGWLTLVTETLQLLLQEQGNTPTLRVDQIKQKWGQLRINGENFSERADAIVREAEEKSAKICEVCGAQGEPKINPRGMMIGVRCAVHINENGKMVLDESNEEARKLASRLAVNTGGMEN